jgi:hypothetical protein
VAPVVSVPSPSGTGLALGAAVAADATTRIVAHAAAATSRARLARSMRLLPEEIKIGYSRPCLRRRTG